MRHPRSTKPLTAMSSDAASSLHSTAGLLSEEKLQEAEKNLKKAGKLSNLSITRWHADWAAATPLYEAAAFAFKLGKKTEKAKECFERASLGHERLGSPWQAAKHLESAGAMAKELRSYAEVADLFRRAADLYTACGKPQPAAEALHKGARALEDGNPDDAVKMYLDSCVILEDEDKEQMAFETYRSATNLFLKLARYQDAAAVLLRWGQGADKCHAVQTQCKAYLSAIIVYLYAENLKDAEQCFNDCVNVDAFLNSEYNRCAEQLLAAYRDGSQDQIKHIITKTSVVSQLDHVILKIARKLPTGNLSALVSVSDDLDEHNLT